MTFVADEPGMRFAVGTAGVFFTLDGALTDSEVEHWHRLLDSDALACQAGPPFFDRQNLLGRVLYGRAPGEA